MICKVCNKTYRKGALAFVMTDKGLKGARVCKGCAGDGVLIVAAHKAPRCSCGKPATTCTHCVEKKQDGERRGAADAGKLAKGIRLRLKAYVASTPTGDASDFVQGVAEGLEQAANFLEKGTW